MTEEQELFWNALSREYPGKKSRTCSNCIHKELSDKLRSIDEKDITFCDKCCSFLSEGNSYALWKWNLMND